MQNQWKQAYFTLDQAEPVPLALKSADHLRDQITVLSIYQISGRPSSSLTYSQGLLSRYYTLKATVNVQFYGQQLWFNIVHCIDEFPVQRGRGICLSPPGHSHPQKLQKNPTPSRIRQWQKYSLSSKITGTIVVKKVESVPLLTWYYKAIFFFLFFIYCYQSACNENGNYFSWRRNHSVVISVSIFSI